MKKYWKFRLLCSLFLLFALQNAVFAQTYRIDLGTLSGSNIYNIPAVTILCPSGSLSNQSSVVPCTFGGGGGGAVTIANGAAANLGFLNDPAWGLTGNASLTSIDKEIAILLSQPLTANGTLNLAIPTQAYSATQTLTVAATSGALYSAGAFVGAVSLQNPSSNTCTVYLNLHGGTAVVGGGGIIPPGNYFVFGTAAQPLPSGSTVPTAISSSGNCTLAVSGG